jgi:hypothetical protein
VGRQPAHRLGVHHTHVVIFSISTGSAGADAVVDVAAGGFQLVEDEALAEVFGGEEGGHLGAGLEFCYALLDGVEALEGFFAVVFDVGVEHFQLGGDVLHGGGEADDGIAGLIVALAKTHSAHCSDTD